MHLRVQVNSMADAAKAKPSEAQIGAKAQKLFDEASARIDGLSQRLDDFREHMTSANQEHVSRASQLGAVISGIERASATSQDHVTRVDHDLEALRHEIRKSGESVGATLNNLATNADIQHLAKRFDDFRAGHEDARKATDQALEQAQNSVGDISRIQGIADETRKRMDEVCHELRKECQSTRTLARHGLAEVRSSMQGLREECRGFVDTASKELNGSISAACEATVRADAGLRDKAELADLTKLQDFVNEVLSHFSSQKQLLIGTKCLSCDRGLAPPCAFTDFSQTCPQAVDLSRLSVAQSSAPQANNGRGAPLMQPPGRSSRPRPVVKTARATSMLEPGPASLRRLTEWTPPSLSRSDTGVREDPLPVLKVRCRPTPDALGSPAEAGEP